MLSLKEIEDIRKLYHERLEKQGYDVTTVGWKNVDEQILRFKILCDISDLTGSSICDIGCGFGDIIPYIKQRFGDFKYSGIDISDQLVHKAAELHPDYNFKCLDILDNSFCERFDYFLLSGALSFRIDDNMALTKAMLSKMFLLANKGVAVNFLSSYVNYQHIRNFHYVPEEIFAFSKTLSKSVTLRHDYPLWEFTIYIYKSE
jgi:trans-aconitate methyltransferase